MIIEMNQRKVIVNHRNEASERHFNYRSIEILSSSQCLTKLRLQMKGGTVYRLIILFQLGKTNYHW